MQAKRISTTNSASKQETVPKRLSPKAVILREGFVNKGHGFHYATSKESVGIFYYCQFMLRITQLLFS